MTLPKSTPAVAGPGADHAFLAAELIAFARRLVERVRNLRPHRVAVRAARVGHIDGEGGAGTAHGDGLAVALALFERRDARGVFGRIVKSLAIGAAFADGKGAGRKCGRRRRHRKHCQSGHNASARCPERKHVSPSPTRESAKFKAAVVSTW